MSPRDRKARVGRDGISGRELLVETGYEKMEVSRSN